MSKLALLFLAPAFSLALRAQTAPAVPPATPSSDDQTVQLNPFEVTANNHGYLGAETTSGTRYAAPVSEIPFNVQVVTSEMIMDYQAFDLAGQSAFQYTGSFSNAFPESSTGVIVVRGVRGFAVFNNGIREGGVYGPASLDRIELVEGESDSIYGQAEPSGAVNRVTKEGQTIPFQSLSLAYGDDDLSRIILDVNQPISQKLLFRVAASYENSQQFAQQFMHFYRQDLYASLTWKIAPDLVFTIHSDYIVLDSTAQSAFQMPFVISPNVVLNGVTTTAVIGQFGYAPWNSRLERTVNLDGPFSYNQVRYSQTDMNLNKTFHDWLSIELLGSYWRRPQENPIVKFAGTNADEYNVATGQIGGTSSLELQANHQFQANGQANLLADFHTGWVHHKILFTSDYVKAGEPFNDAVKSTLANASTNLNNYLTGGPYYTPGFPSGIDFGNTAVWNSLQTNQRSSTITKGAMLNERAGFFDNDRLIVSVGLRHDQIDQGLINYLASTTVSSTGKVLPAGQLVDYPEAKDWTYQTGAVFKFSPQLVCFADFATDFVPQAANIPVDLEHNPISPVTGEGSDFGFKSDFFDHKLSFTTDVYDALRRNLAVAALTPSGAAADFPGTSTQYDDVDAARYYGWEVDLTWNPTPNLTVTGGIGFTRGKYVAVDNATQQYLVGLTPDDTPEWAGGVFAKYHFPGRLKGFVARLGVSGQSQELISNSTVSVYGNSNAKGPVLTENGQAFQEYLFRDAGFAIVNPGISYEWKSGRSFQSVGLNFTNALNKTYFVQPNLMEGIAGNVTYSIRM